MTKSTHSNHLQNPITIVGGESKGQRNRKSESSDTGVERQSDISNGAKVGQTTMTSVKRYGSEASWYDRQARGASHVPPLWMAFLIGIPALIAAGFAGYLFGVWYNKTGVVGCSGSLYDCDHVLSSKWSSWMGMPVSGLALLNYVVLLGALVMGQVGSYNSRRWMWNIVTFCGLSACLAAIWFIAVQGFVLNHWCLYCMFAHGCGIFIGISLLTLKPLGQATNLRMGGLALLGLAVLAGGQIFSPELDSESFIEKGYDDLPPIINDQDFDFDGFETFDADQTGEGMLFESPDIFEAPEIFEAPDLGWMRSRRGGVGQFSGQALLSQFYQLASITSPVAFLTYQDGEELSDAEEPVSETSPSTSQPTERRFAELRNGQIKLEINKWPNCGNEAAEYVVVEMFDYNCRACRVTHQAVVEARKLMGDKLAVVALPVPLNTNCNNQVRQNLPQFAESCQLSMLAVAVWRVAPEKFPQFHNWMFEQNPTPNYNSALNYARGLVDSQKLDETLKSNLPNAYIQKHVQLYRNVGGGTVPKLMFPTTMIIGEYSSGSSLQNTIKEHGKVTVISTSE